MKPIAVGEREIRFGRSRRVPCTATQADNHRLVHADDVAATLARRMARPVGGRAQRRAAGFTAAQGVLVRVHAGRG